ncbi:hypothetical protein PGT21_020566 [Puccinia graminis f. sp. tritici]|uniref:Uncharacterized protein n=1 Tax=Puccinia graminis f. sp. tritici TaxID=56615 RepID=A0A5B0QXU8_PUCGR|nr:hypothetical protein PGT21_020566 [Puccinia graminis f. sp. tritici]
MQEAAQKDVERAFGVLQARFAIVARPALSWSAKKLHLNMAPQLINPITSCRADFSTFVSNIQQIRNADLHFALRNDLIAHLWARKGKEVVSENDDV